MSFRKLKAYSRMIGIVLVFMLVVIFMASNREATTVKFLKWQIWQAPKFLVLFGAAVLGVVVFWILTKVRRIVREIRQIKREENKRQEIMQQVKKELNDQKEPARNPPDSVNNQDNTNKSANENSVADSTADKKE